MCNHKKGRVAVSAKVQLPQWQTAGIEGEKKYVCSNHVPVVSSCPVLCPARAMQDAACKAGERRVVVGVLKSKRRRARRRARAYACAARARARAYAKAHAKARKSHAPRVVRNDEEGLMMMYSGGRGVKV